MALPGPPNSADSVIFRYKSLVGMNELPAANGENCVSLLSKLCPLSPGSYHVGVTKVKFWHVNLFWGKCLNADFLHNLFFPVYAQTAAVSEGRHLSDVGVQTGANAPPCRPHSAALRPHVLCEKALSGLPQEDCLAASTVPRLPYTVGSRTSQSLTSVVTKIRDVMVFPLTLPSRKRYVKMRHSVLRFRSLVHMYITQKQYIKVDRRWCVWAFQVSRGESV